MSMNTLTILQCSVIFVVYTVLTCVLPFSVLNCRLRGFRLSVRLMISYVVGNFYIINLVFALQLLHISNRWTLLACTVIPYIWILAKVRHFPIWENFKSLCILFYRIVQGEQGLKTFLLRTFRQAVSRLAAFIKKCVGVLKRNPIDTVLFVALTVLMVWMYGTNMLENYGYCLSDLPVHNYWINYMSRGQIFVAGVYPFGFHCMIYYMHAVFGLPTYVLLRVFYLTQTLYIHWILLIFMKLVFKSRYLPYMGVAFYTTAIFLSINYRYTATLPQEFGMIFILPAVYFGFAFFEYRKQELAQEPDAESISRKDKRKKKKELRAQKRMQRKEKKLREKTGLWQRGKHFLHACRDACARLTVRIGKLLRHLKKSDWCLIGFAMSFSLTLAIHFYDTMIAGIFCVMMAIAFFFRFFDKRYFVRIVVTCIVSVVIAVLPMAIAFIGGTPLQGSLGWGLSIINGSDDEETETAAGTEPTAETEAASENIGGAESGDNSVSASGEPDAAGSNGDGVSEEATWTEDTLVEIPVEEEKSFSEKLKETAYGIAHNLLSYVFRGGKDFYSYIFYGFAAVQILLALLFFVLRQTDYAARMLCIAGNSVLLSILISSGRLGIPALMDGSRYSIYFRYFLAPVGCGVIDGILILLFDHFRQKHLLNLVSLAVVCGGTTAFVKLDLVREPYVITHFETNEAVTCLTNIISENEDWMWTICSANDELRMAEDYGYHYETIEFLRKMEYSGKYADITIPTPHVYFFVEKVPLDYAVHYENSGQRISEEGASRQLPYSGGLGPYQGESRWIVMSRMYYWAEAFMEMYPNDMTVYFENENFICYQLEQNVDNVFDLGIDYGYNVIPIEQSATASE